MNTGPQRHYQWRPTRSLNVVMWAQMKCTKGVYLFFTGVMSVIIRHFEALYYMEQQCEPLHTQMRLG